MGEPMRLKDKTAIVTGGASGFGAGIVRKFIAEGARVMIADLNAEAAGTLAADLGPHALVRRVDVSSAQSVADMAEAALEAFDRHLDILVNNAGVSHMPAPLDEISEADFDRVLAVNVKSVYLTARALVPQFKAQEEGVILNIASTAGVRPRPGLTWYNGSKGAALTLTKSMAAELASKNIRVNAINPVIGETGMIEQFMGMPDTPENRAKFTAGIPLGRFSKPSDIANAALFFADPASAFITGTAIEVDGGRCI